MKLNSLYVAATDMTRSIEFYSRLFRKSPSVNTGQFAEFDLGGLKFGLLDSSKYGHPLVMGNNCVPTFEVSDIEIERTRICRMSQKVSDVRSVGPYTLFEFTDPDGNVIECFVTSECMAGGTGKARNMVQSAAHKAVDGWFDDYVNRVYGVQSEKLVPREAGAAKTVKLTAKQLADRLSARFHELDLVPKDGLVSYIEIERAITNPLLHWDETDIAMLKLLRRYYHSLIELSDDELAIDQGISINDVEALANGIGERVEAFRSKFESEQI